MNRTIRRCETGKSCRLQRKGVDLDESKRSMQVRGVLPFRVQPIKFRAPGFPGSPRDALGPEDETAFVTVLLISQHCEMYFF